MPVAAAVPEAARAGRAPQGARGLKYKSVGLIRRELLVVPRKGHVD